MATILGKAVGSAAFVYHRAMKIARKGRWPLTIGVRVGLISPDDQVLLVKHTYTPGWHFPGGAVDPRETMADAAVRELREETLMGAQSDPELFGIYLNMTENKSDHIAFFVVKDWTPVEGKSRPLEIAEARFFPVSALPEGTTGGTRRRLQEIRTGGTKSPRW